MQAQAILPDGAAAAIVRDGYAICPGVLKPDDVAHYLDEARHLYEQERQQIAAGSRANDADYMMYKDYGDHIFNLARKSRVFDPLYHHPLVMQALGEVMGNRFILTQTEMRRPHTQAAQGSANVYHRDGRIVVDADLWVTAFWALEDITPSNGPTWVLPGTHRRAADGEVDDARAVPLLAKAGDLILMNSNLLHRAGPKLDDSSRWVLIITYNQWFLKPAVDHTRLFTRAQVDAMDPHLRDLFGYTSQPPADERLRMYTCRPWDISGKDFPFPP